MKILSSVVVCAFTLSVTGCSSLDNPLSAFNPFHRGRDARVYNAQTGEYEWPKEEAARQQPARHGAAGAAPQERRGDGRYFDAQKNEWVDAPRDDVSTSQPKEKSAPSSRVNLDQPVVTPAQDTEPPPSPPARASGVYNPSTGRIDWDASGAAPAPTPAPRKGWRLWPF
jgi:hypothetical protein